MDRYVHSQYLIQGTLNYRPPCSLDFNIHQLILSDLAASVGASKVDPAEPTIDSSIDLITSNVTTRAISGDDVDLNGTSTTLEERVFMVGVPSGHLCDNFTVFLSRLRERDATLGSRSSL
jgi:hypothetical protein